MSTENTSETPAAPEELKAGEVAEVKKPVDETAGVVPTEAAVGEAETPPAKPPRDPWLIQLAADAGLSPEQVASIPTDAELTRTIAIVGRRPRPTPEVPATPAAPEAEPEYELPKEIADQLDELNPVLRQALAHVGKDAVRSKKEAQEAKEALAHLQAQRQFEEFEKSTHEIMNRYPKSLGKTRPDAGSPEDFRRRAIVNHLGTLERAGQLKGMSQQAAIDMAVKLLFAGDATGASPPPPPAPAKKPPTPTTPPTNRDGAYEEEPLEEMWRKGIEENDREWEEKEKAAGRNGVFIP